MKSFVYLSFFFNIVIYSKKYLYFSAGESYTAFTKSITDMENHWERLHHLLSDTQNKVDLNIETKKLYNELNMLKDLILSYEKWANTVESVAEEAGEISKQLEQCRVCHFSGVHIADILAVWSPNNIITQWCSS